LTRDATNQPKSKNLMKKTTSILAALAMGVVSATAGVEPAPVSSGKGVAPPPPPIDPCAGPISYNNVELLYVYTDLDFGGDNGDGGRLNIEYSPMANFYLRLGGEYSTFDIVDTWWLYGGIGAYFPLTDNIHIAADGGVVYSDISVDDYLVVEPLGDNGDLDDNDTGWYVRPHIRAKWGCFEVHAGATYRDVWEDESWNYWVAAYYQVAPNWDITAGYSDGDGDLDGEVITAGVRWRY
jgi:hypothetical protein